MAMTVICVGNGSWATMPSVMAMISADRMKSVRMAPLTRSFSFSGACSPAAGVGSARA